jgi:hypothetical protein
MVGLPRRPLLCSAVLAALVAGGLLVAAPERARAADPVVPDYEFFKEFVAPVLQEVCAECHANPRKRLGKYFLKPMPGRTVRESHHRDNYETILGLIEPGNPSASLWLLKPLGPRQGGVTHKGGERIDTNAAAYGAMVDFIQGRKLQRREFVPPPTPEGQPDFLFFQARIAPTLAAVCAECHAGKGQGKMVLRTAPPGETLALADSYANYETVLQLVDAARPERSRFLVKPLAVADGGVPHKGGDRIRKGDANHVNWLAFLRGERGPALAPGAQRTGPLLLEAGLVIEAESMGREAGLEEQHDPVALEQRWIAGGAKGGRLVQSLRVPEGGDYRVALHVVGGRGPVGVALDGQAPVYVDVPPAGRAEVGPQFLLDGAAALRSTQGDLVPTERGLALDGRGGEASFLAAAEVDHRAVEARFALLDEEEGGDDVWLLFDMLDADNGKLAGLVDGGRRFVMGVLEGGVSRIIASAKPFAAEHGAESRTLRVDLLDGVAVGKIDGQPLAFLHLDRHLGQGGFGMATHGVVEVLSLEAIDQFPVHKVAFGLGPILHLTAGVHTLEVELPAQGVALDRVVLTLSE